MKKPIGQLVRQVLDQNGMKLKVFADRIGTTRQNVYKIFEKDSIRTDRLLRISEVLDYDFFAHFRIHPTATKSALQGRSGPAVGEAPSRYAALLKKLEMANERIALLEVRLADKEEIIALLRGR